MFWTRLAISLTEFALSILLSVFIVFWSYKSFIRVNRSNFDAEKEILRGNAAVALLMASLMYGASVIMRNSIYPVVSIVTLAFTGGEDGHSLPVLAAYAAGHLFFGFLLAVGVVQIALKLFEGLNRDLDEMSEIGKGNTAVAIIMGAVIVITALFMEQGVSALTKSLIPQPKLGELRMMD